MLKVVGKKKDATKKPEAKKKLKVVDPVDDDGFAEAREVETEDEGEGLSEGTLDNLKKIEKTAKAKKTAKVEKKKPRFETLAAMVASSTKVKEPKKDNRPVKAEAKTVEVVDSSSIMEEARAAYKTLQVSWYTFAKRLKEIRDAKLWENTGFADFSALCRAEFSAIPTSTISKFIRVVEEFGVVLEARMNKGIKVLPSYDALYDVAVNEAKLPKDESARLRKAVVDGEITQLEVREKIRSLVTDKKPNKHAESRGEKRRARREEIGLKEEIVEIETEDSDVEVDEKTEITGSIDRDADALLKTVKEIISKLPGVTDSLTEGTSKLVELAEAIEVVQVTLNDYLDKLEKVSNVD